MLAYLQLIRLPTVFTAMADIFLGYLLTHGGFEPWPKFAGLLAASSGLYLAGMVFNDVFDVKQDAIERSNRPIPSGRVSLAAAAVLGGVLLLVGIVAASRVGPRCATLAVCLALAILAYDAVLKHTPLGPFGMGLCRFLNVMLGASDLAGEGTPLWANPQLACATGLGIYIVGVTWFARTEARVSSRRQLVGALLVVLSGIGILAGLVAATPAGPANPTIVYLMLGMIAANVALRAASAIGDPTPARVQPNIKLMLLSYVMLCATMVYWHAGDGRPALLTACLVIPALLLGRVIPMT
jgi:4-hydroxybenzoate polyprenyltransferase